MTKRCALEIDHVSKTYPNGSRAIRDISLSVQPGTVLGLIGPNGAGKSTLLKVASGLLTPEEGNVSCGTEDITGRAERAAAFVGLMPDPLGVYTDISASDYLEFFARILELSPEEQRRRIERAVSMLALGPWLDSEVEELSAGWQRRLALGRILLQDVPILLLDEPAAGLDISARGELLSVVRTLADDGHTIVVSSHILPELEELADRFAVINNGAWVDVRPGQIFFNREDLRRGFSQARWRIRCEHALSVAAQLKERNISSSVIADQILEFCAADDREASSTLGAIASGGEVIFEFGPCHVELNDFVRTLLAPGADRHEA